MIVPRTESVRKSGVNRRGQSLNRQQTLVALEEAGLATRTAGAREGTQRVPDQWQAFIQPEPV